MTEVNSAIIGEVSVIIGSVLTSVKIYLDIGFVNYNGNVAAVVTALLVDLESNNNVSSYLHLSIQIQENIIVLGHKA